MTTPSVPDADGSLAFRLRAISLRWLRHDYRERLLATVLLGGSLLRVRQYLHNRSLWVDESSLAINIIPRSVSRLFLPLDHDQGAPVGFLLLEKAAIAVFGPSEYALRLVPLLAGLLALFLFYPVFRRLVHPNAAFVGLVLFALAQPMIYYASEVKQYSTDSAVTLLLIGLAMAVVHRASSRIHLTVFCIAGAVTIWFSHAAVLVLAGIGSVLVLRSFVRSDHSGSARLLAVCSVWLVSFFALYRLSLTGLLENPYLTSFWRKDFMPLPPTSLADLKWFGSVFFFDVFEYPGGLAAAGLAAALFIVGAISLYRNKRLSFYMLVSPLIVTLIASGFHKYPFGDRLILFLVPLMLVIIGVGAERLRSLTHRSGPEVTIVVLAMLFITPLYSAVDSFVNPIDREEIRAVLDHVAARKSPNDVVYVHYGATPAFAYYESRYDFSENEVIQGLDFSNDWRAYQEEVDHLADLGRRTWVLFSHIQSGGEVNDKAAFLAFLAARSVQIDEVGEVGASAHLHVFR